MSTSVSDNDETPYDQLEESVIEAIESLAGDARGLVDDEETDLTAQRVEELIFAMLCDDDFRGTKSSAFSEYVEDELDN